LAGADRGEGDESDGGSMSEGFDRRRHRFPGSRHFEDLAVGEHFYIPSRTVTDADFAAFRTVSGDNHPIHYDIEYCRERGHPDLLAHGFQVLCFTAIGAGTFAHVIGDVLIAFIEQSAKFLKPVYPGDTLYPNLTIAALTPQRTTGVVTVAVTIHNQRDELVLTGEQKYLLKKRDSPKASS
jgi:acyl dehydratase